MPNIKYQTSKLTKFKIRKGDIVLVLAGKDRNKTGQVIRVDREKGRVVVEKINLAKKHLKPNQQYPQGGIIDIPRPLDISKVMVVCPHCQKPTRIGSKVTTDKKQKRLRLCRRCQQSL